MNDKSWKPDKVHFILGFVLVVTVCSIWLIPDKKAGRHEASIRDKNSADLENKEKVGNISYEDLENRIDRLEKGQVALQQVDTRLQALERRASQGEKEQIALQKNINQKLKGLIAEMNKAISQVNKFSSSASLTPAKTFSSDYPQKGFVHKVEKGETVRSIAQKYNSREQWILDANLIVDPIKVFEGKELFIPRETPVSVKGDKKVNAKDTPSIGLGDLDLNDIDLSNLTPDEPTPQKQIEDKIDSFCDEILKVDERLQEATSSQFSSKAIKILGTAESLAKEFYPSIELDYQDLIQVINETVIKYEDKAIDPNISPGQRSRYDQLADSFKKTRMTHIEATKILKKSREDWNRFEKLLKAGAGQKQILDSWKIFTGHFRPLVDVHYDYE